MMLADSAQAVGGKLYILGGGWSQTGPMPSPSAVAMKFDVPWDQANHRFRVLLELLTADGDPVMIPGPEGEQPLRVEGQLETGRPPGLKQGSPLDAVMALNFGPVPLQPDSRYEWRLTVDGQHEAEWSLPFGTRPVPEAVQR